MEIPQLSQADLALLRKFDTPTICNVIEVFKVRPQTAGYLDGRIRACFPEMPPMAGYASTVRAFGRRWRPSRSAGLTPVPT